MKPKGPEPLPIACDAAAIPGEDRDAHFALLEQLFTTQLEGAEPLPDGYEFRFGAGAVDSVLRFVQRERICCPFLSFTVEVAAARGPVRLRLAGPPGTAEFLESQFARRQRS